MPCDNTSSGHGFSISVSFLFIQNEGGMQRIPAGKLARNGSGFAGRVETPVDRMAGSEYAFDRIDGIYLSGPENVFYATTWKDITVSGAAPEKEADGWKAEDDRDDGNRSDAGSGSEESRPQAGEHGIYRNPAGIRKGRTCAAASGCSGRCLAGSNGTGGGIFAEASSVEACSRRERPDFGERMLSRVPENVPV